MIDFKNKKTLTLMITAGVLFIITACAILFLLASPAQKIELPNFIDKTLQDIETWKTENKLDNTQIIIEKVYDENSAENTVLSQNLPALTVLTKEDQIIFTVSKGPDPDLIISLPENIKSMKEDELKEFFKSNRFTDVTYEYVTSDKIKSGLFAGINITENQAKRSDMIIVQISVGTESIGIDIPMPDFTNDTKNAIDAWADVNNITVTYNTAFSDTVESGKAISQSPEGGTIIQTGSKITITISSGKAIKLEDLVGKTKEEVEKWAKEMNAKVEFISYYAQKTEKGKVISTSPSAGSVSENTTIKVYISLGKVVMENFIGKKEADVKKWIETINTSINEKSSHISYKIIKSKTNEVKPGQIIKTNPAKDETVPFSTVIQITVAEEDTVKIEKKTGVTLTELKKYLEDQNMKLGKETKSYSTDIKKDLIITHDTGTFKTETSINYTISLGAYQPESSSFNNKTQDEVKKIISDANALNAGWNSPIFTEEFSDTTASQKTFGCQVDVSKKTVTCKISKGIGISVPDYVTQNRKPCSTNSCTVDNLSITQTEVYDASQPGTVLSQSIVPGTVVAKNTVLTLVISKGPEPTPTPTPTPESTPTPTPEVTVEPTPETPQEIVISDAQVAALENCRVPGDANATKNAVISYIMNDLKFINTPNVQIVNGDQTAGEIVNAGNFTAGTHPNTTVFTIQIASGQQ